MLPTELMIASDDVSSGSDGDNNNSVVYEYDTSLVSCRVPAVNPVDTLTFDLHLFLWGHVIESNETVVEYLPNPDGSHAAVYTQNVTFLREFNGGAFHCDAVYDSYNYSVVLTSEMMDITVFCE